MIVYERVPGEQPTQTRFVYRTLTQCGVEASPTSAVGQCEAEMRRRSHIPAGKHGIRKLEESIGSLAQTSVEALAELMQSPAAEALLLKSSTLVYGNFRGFLGKLSFPVIGKIVSGGEYGEQRYHGLRLYLVAAAPFLRYESGGL